LVLLTATVTGAQIAQACRETEVKRRSVRRRTGRAGRYLRFFVGLKKEPSIFEDYRSKES
jgi:hypothetical protein